MPDREAHKLINRLLTGNDGDKIHQVIDLPFLLEQYKQFLTPQAVEQLYRELRPANSRYDTGHRQAFHTLEEAILLGNLIDGSRGIQNAVLHVLADEIFHTKEAKLWLKLLVNANRQKQPNTSPYGNRY